MAAAIAFSKRINKMLLLHRLVRDVDIDAQSVLAMPIGVLKHIFFIASAAPSWLMIVAGGENMK